ncbi:2933_t:CDS:2 [Diversispora eburnea]|uniref:2933_t:CDS:1 n=1 Tax=Diversispora eburnea TaxID=1213867 RepID=A0A9N9FRW5_9GLOM|nr:2933_t:CDS:2 [Diversispora eburnea]
MSTITINPHLPNDCLRDIFKYLTHQPKSLHSCLLVNRLWCENAVPILWRDPFRYNRTFYYDSNYWKSITHIILLCLPQESKDIFKSNNIKLPKLSSKPPLFDYVGYCQYISCQDIYEIIPEIIGSEQSFADISWYYNLNLVENEIWKMFMNRCQTLKYVEIPNVSLPYIPGSSICLPQLTELECSTYKSPKLFVDLAQVVKDLVRLVINLCDEDNNGLISLITSQNGLKEVKLVSSEGNECPGIGQALITQATTLISIEFEENLCLQPEHLSTLTNLKRLSIDLEEDNSGLNLLESVNLPKLEILEVEYVSFWYFNEVFKDLEEFLTCSIQLKGINIEAVIDENDNNSEENWLDSCDVLGLIVNKASTNLEEIVLSGAWNLSLEDLQDFLEGWRKRKSLYLRISINFELTNEHIEMLNDYEAIGLLKGWSRW